MSVVAIRSFQRVWRDAHDDDAHISLNWDAVSTMYGQYPLGLEPRGQYWKTAACSPGRADIRPVGGDPAVHSQPHFQERGRRRRVRQGRRVGDIAPAIH
jgi:hypothetical protein